MYDGKKQPVCHHLRRPDPIPETRTAIELWTLVSDDRPLGFGAIGTVLTTTMLAICEAYGAGWVDFLHMKIIERTYYPLLTAKSNAPKPKTK